MRDFEILFDTPEDSGEGIGSVPAEAARYGPLAFPAPPAGRPWIYANFVQTVDGIVSLLGEEAGGSDIAGLAEDRWLMDLLRVHADAVMIGMGSLRAEQRMQRPGPRGPVFRIVDPELQRLRARMGRARERNVLVSARGNFRLDDFAVFDGRHVDASILTTPAGAANLRDQVAAHPAVDLVIVDSAGDGVDVEQAVAELHKRYGIRYLLCEGGPMLYSRLLAAGLVDEMFLTVSPLTVGAQSDEGRRPTLLPEASFSRENAVRWRWLSCRKVADHQFHRFRR